jgi:hypothetical protein
LAKESGAWILYGFQVGVGVSMNVLLHVVDVVDVAVD